MLLGASNLALGLSAAIDEAGRRWGSPLEVLAAGGLGRSYGLDSFVLGRRLPPLLECGLWRALEGGGSAPTSAVVADPGNDLVFGVGAARLVDWMGECVRRLQERGARVAVVGLPLARLQEVGAAGFHLTRSLFYPAHPIGRETLMREAREATRGLDELCTARGVALVQPERDWYGLDPIHVRCGARRQAWRAAFAACGPEPSPDGAAPRARTTWHLRPERSWLFGRERRQAQPVRTWPDGSTLSLF